MPTQALLGTVKLEYAVQADTLIRKLQPSLDGIYHGFIVGEGFMNYFESYEPTTRTAWVKDTLFSFAFRRDVKQACRDLKQDLHVYTADGAMRPWQPGMSLAPYRGDEAILVAEVTYRRGRMDDLLKQYS